MEPKECMPDEPMCGGASESMHGGYMERKKVIDSRRRRELLAVAVKLSEEIERTTKQSERQLLFNMIDNLIGG
jgi:hypothetical protein